jgi:hypothetical protein
LAAIAKERTLLRQITAYRELTDLFDFFAKLSIISLSVDAVDLFNGFRKSGIKIGFFRTFDDPGRPPDTAALIFPGISDRWEPEQGRLHRKCGRTQNRYHGPEDGLHRDRQ